MLVSLIIWIQLVGVHRDKNTNDGSWKRSRQNPFKIFIEKLSYDSIHNIIYFSSNPIHHMHFLILFRPDLFAVFVLISS